MITSGDLQNHIDNVPIPIYAIRYRVLMYAVKTHLQPFGVRITTGAPYMIPEDENTVVPVGGFFTYIRSPGRLPPAEVIVKRAREDYALTFAFGEIFFVKGDESSLERAKTVFGTGARLCWAWHEIDVIEEGIIRLAALLKIMLEESKST